VENVTVRSCCRITSTGFILISLCRHLSWRFIIRWGMWLGLILVYEYIFTVDADTVHFSALLIFILALLIVLLVSRLLLSRFSNCLVASSADDSNYWYVSSRNKEGSCWTMIQVYEYYISCHLSKAFESLFGSVTCLLLFSLSTVFVPLIKEGQSSSLVTSNLTVHNHCELAILPDSAGIIWFCFFHVVLFCRTNVHQLACGK